MTEVRTDFATATRGHYIGIRKPPVYKTWAIFCTCGWSMDRPKETIEVMNRGLTVFRTRDLPVRKFRDLGQDHLYEIWERTQESQLGGSE